MQKSKAFVFYFTEVLLIPSAKEGDQPNTSTDGIGQETDKLSATTEIQAAKVVTKENGDTDSDKLTEFPAAQTDDLATDNLGQESATKQADVQDMEIGGSSAATSQTPATSPAGSMNTN